MLLHIKGSTFASFFKKKINIILPALIFFFFWFLSPIFFVLPFNNGTFRKKRHFIDNKIKDDKIVDRKCHREDIS